MKKLLSVFVAFMMMFTLMGPVALAEDPTPTPDPTPEPTPAPTGTLIPIPSDGIEIYESPTNTFNGHTYSWKIFLLSLDSYVVASYLDGNLFERTTRFVSQPPPDDSGVIVPDLAISDNAVNIGGNGQSDPDLVDPGRSNEGLSPASVDPVAGSLEGYYDLGTVGLDPDYLLKGQKYVTARVYRKLVDGYPSPASSAIEYSAVEHPEEAIAFLTDKFIEFIFDDIVDAIEGLPEPIKDELKLGNCEEGLDYTLFFAEKLANAVVPGMGTLFELIDKAFIALEVVRAILLQGHIVQLINYRYNYVVVIDNSVVYRNVYNEFHWVLEQHKDGGAQEFTCYESFPENPPNIKLPDGSQGGPYEYNTNLSVSLIVRNLVAYYMMNGNHNHDFKDDNDCVCKICLYQRWDHDYQWVSDHLTSDPLSPIGHLYKCTKCGEVQTSGEHQIGNWKYKDAVWEIKECEICRLPVTQNTRRHDLAYSWDYNIPDYTVCTGGNTVYTDCRNDCEDYHALSHSNTIYPTYHIPDGLGACAICKLPTHCWDGHTITNCTEGICSICKGQFYAQPSHDYQWASDYLAPDPHAPIGHLYKCTRCGYVLESESGEHTFGAWVYKDAVWESRECSVCHLPVLGTRPHDLAYSWDYNIPDYTVCTGGNTVYTDCRNECENYHDLSHNNVINPTTHFDTVVINVCDICKLPRACWEGHNIADCTIGICSNCTNQYAVQNHDFKWREVDLVNGKGHEKYCTRCDYTEPQQIHGYKGSCEYINPANCSGMCSICKLESTMKTFEHLHVTWYWDPTGYDPSHELNDCSYCGYRITRDHGYDISMYVYTFEENRFSKVSPQYICENGGYYYGKQCVRTYMCNYIEEASSPDFVYVPKGHVDYTNDFVCDRCLQKTPCYYSGKHSYNNTCTDTACAACQAPREAPGHICSDCRKPTCDVCGETYRVATDHTFTYSPYTKVGTSDICQTRIEYCSKCDYQKTLVEGHAYFDKCDPTCNNSCGLPPRTPPHDPFYSIYSADTTKHLLSCRICQATFAIQNHEYENTCTAYCKYSCGYQRSEIPHQPGSWINSSATTHRKYCGYMYCGIMLDEQDHYYKNCSDGSCEAPGCTYSRGDISGVVVGGHVYPGCTVAVCSRCNYVRAPGVHGTPAAWSIFDSAEHRGICPTVGCGQYVYNDHGGYTYGAWVNKKQTSLCRQRVVTCGYCTYNYIENDTSHGYTNCVDPTCNTCGYDRTSVPGVPGHSRPYNPHTHLVSTAATCYQNVVYCGVCNYEYVTSTETHHSLPSTWTRTDATNHRRDCSVCNYYESVAHSYYSGTNTATRSSTTEHYHVCKASGCGNHKTEVHSFHVDGAGRHCEECGYFYIP